MSGPNVIADPGIRIGAYRILVTTDGWWIAVDERNEIGDRTVGRRRSKDAILAFAECMVGEGSPQLPGLPAVAIATSSPRTSSSTPSTSFALSGASPIGTSARRTTTGRKKKAS